MGVAAKISLELWIKIFANYLQIGDLLNLRLICRFFCRLVDDFVWKLKFDAAYFGAYFPKPTTTMNFRDSYFLRWKIYKNLINQGKKRRKCCRFRLEERSIPWICLENGHDLFYTTNSTIIRSKLSAENLLDRNFEYLANRDDILNRFVVSGDLIVSASYSGKLYVWRGAKNPILVERCHNSELHCVSTSSENSQITTGSKDGFLKFWRFKSENKLKMDDKIDFQDRIWCTDLEKMDQRIRIFFSVWFWEERYDNSLFSLDHDGRNALVVGASLGGLVWFFDIRMNRPLTEGCIVFYSNLYLL
uniref:Uncharacterized protein n=1 Tax=Romanomermis culicivorax TaxID=13658 RepID=A0A915IMT2_ROMCU